MKTKKSKTTLSNKCDKLWRSTLRNKADKLFSQKIRDKGRCEKCGVASNLQCAHIISRSYFGTRFDLANAVCLCQGCHMYFTHHPLEWENWVDDNYGCYKALKRRALDHIKLGHKLDYEAIILQLKEGR